MDNERRTMIRELRGRPAAELLAKFRTMTIPEAKSADDSATQRQKALFLYKREKHDVTMHERIVGYATCSIGRAPANSESLALAYAERARIFVHTRKYKDCLLDCNRGLAIAACPLQARFDLHKRKLESLVFLGLPVEQRELEDALNCNEELRKAETDGLLSIDEVEMTVVLDNMEILMCRGVRTIRQQQPTDDDYDAPTHEAVEVRGDHRWGRYLAATRDIRCGEILLIEKYHVAAQSRGIENQTCCRHCLRFAWAVVPCDTCDDHYFCSESCKIQAWQEYHEVECELMHALHWYKAYLDENIVLAVKIVLKAIKETGSIENLKKLVAEIDACDDKIKRGMTNEEFCSNFRAFYSSTGLCPNDRHNYLVFANVLITVALVKYTQLFDPKVNYESCADMASNRDVVFIGALLIKIATMCTTSYKPMIEPNSEMAADENDTMVYYRTADYVRGKIMAPYASLINHSCNPNVHKMHIAGGKIIYFSILPIPKGQQIFECYYHPFYSTKPLDKRREYLEDCYKFTCHCDACTLGWGSAAARPDNRVEHYEINPEGFQSISIAGPLARNLIDLLNRLSSYEPLRMVGARLGIARGIEALDVFPFPNPVSVAYVLALRYAFELTHGMICITMPAKCGTTQVPRPLVPALPPQPSTSSE